MPLKILNTELKRTLNEPSPRRQWFESRARQIQGKTKIVYYYTIAVKENTY